jgi:hypothetical protein
MASPVQAVPVPLATGADFQRRFPELCRNKDPLVIDEIMVEATAHIEGRVSRRLSPFTGHMYQDRLWGIDPEEYGSDTLQIPIDIYGSLGISYASAMGASNLVRHFWLDQFAPVYPELWSYVIEEMYIILTYGNQQKIDLTTGGLIAGPDVTDGHCWLRLGTFAPEGTRIYVVYSGGYTGGIPSNLSRACLYQAAKFCMLEAEPQNRSSMNFNEIDHQLDVLLADWVRG